MIRLGTISVALLLVSSCTTPDSGDVKIDESVNIGKELYNNTCAACHGLDGKLKAGNASDLSLSELSEEELLEVIENGRGGMPPQDHVYSSDNELKEIANYVNELRK